MRIRSSLLTLTLGAIVVAFPVAPATAGVILVTYTLAGGSLDLSFSQHVSPTFGSTTFRLTAFRASPAAASGTIVSGSILALALTGIDSNLGVRQTWSTGPLAIPIPITGMFWGLTATGMAFTPGGGFSAFAFTPVGTRYLTHGAFFNFPVPGSGFVTLYGGATTGMGHHCWNGVVALGACTAFTPLNPPFSGLVPSVTTLPGFNVVGAEVLASRSIALPEPRLWLLLGPGIAALLVIGWGRMARR